MAEEGPRPWYAPGLYRRVLEHRRFNPPRPKAEPRPPIWRRLWAARPGWKIEAVVLLFVVVTSLALGAAAFELHRSSSAAPAPARATAPAQPGQLPGAAGAPAQPTPTADCLAAPVVYATKRPCLH